MKCYVKGLLEFAISICAYAQLHAQFNENLNKEILAIAKQNKLDGLSPDEVLGVLDKISPEFTEDQIAANLTGQSWKYSHCVSPQGRQFRLSNGIQVLNFSESGDAYFITQQKTSVNVPCRWEYDGLLLIDEYTSAAREDLIARYHYGMHTLTEDRLVITKVIKSKTYTGKMSILYYVYFRR